MKRRNLGLACLMATILAASSLLGACSSIRALSSGAKVDGATLSFDGVAYDADGQAVVTTDDSLGAVVGISYTGPGTVKGEWTVDGKKTPVTLELPAIVQTADEDEEGNDAGQPMVRTSSIQPVKLDLPTGSTGIHRVSFALTSPKKVSTDPIEYLVQSAPPPANMVGSNMVSLTVKSIKARMDGDPGEDEYALWIVASTYDPAGLRTLTAGQPSNGYKIPPASGSDYPVYGDTPLPATFTLNRELGGPWEVATTLGFQIDIAAIEEDSAAWLKALLTAVGGVVAAQTSFDSTSLIDNIGVSDLLGVTSWNISAEELAKIAKGELSGTYTKTFGPTEKGWVDVTLQVDVYINR